MGFVSIPIYARPISFAVIAVVPLPTNGSKTIPFSGQPALIRTLTNFLGYIARWGIPFGDAVAI